MKEGKMKRIIAMALVGVFLFTGVVFSAPVQWSVADGGNDHWYDVVLGDTWLQAESIAVSFGGHLVTVNSASEQSWLDATFPTFTQSFWIGFNDTAAEGNWVWTSGESVTYTHWGGSEPNNHNDEDYGAMGKAVGGSYWFDVNVDGTGGGGGDLFVDYGIAEYTSNPVPEPTTMLLLGAGLLGLAGTRRRMKKYIGLGKYNSRRRGQMALIEKKIAHIVLILSCFFFGVFNPVFADNFDVIETIALEKQGPSEVVVSPDGQYAYVSHWLNYKGLSKIRTFDNSLSETIEVGYHVGHFDITSDGKYAYLPTFYSNKVVVLNLSDYSIQEITGFSQPYSLSITPNGSFAYVTNYNANKVSVIRISDNIKIADIPVQTRPVSVGITPNGYFVYVTNSGSNSISVISTETNTVVNIIENFNLPHDIAINPNGQYAYVTNFFDSEVSVIRLSDNTVSDTITVGSSPWYLGISPLGDYLYVSNSGDDTVSIIRLEDNSIVGTVSVGRRPYGLDVSNDGEKAYISNVWGDTISILEKQSNQPPVAACQNVTILADNKCIGCASIDDGSFDPDDDELTWVQDPDCDYALGTTDVLLAVTDPNGESDSCTANVTVVDEILPKIQMDVPDNITPPDAPISFTASTTDNCSASVAVTGYDCYKFTKKGKRIDKTESCVVELSGDTITIVDSGGVGDNIEWYVTATDGSGNQTEATFKVEVVNPGKKKGKNDDPIIE